MPHARRPSKRRFPFPLVQALLAHADAFIGTASSFTSRVILLAIAGERGAVPPFAMVDRPLHELWFAHE